MLTDEAVKDFRHLYMQEYRVDLTDSQAQEQGLRLINLVRAVYGKDLPKLKDLDKKSEKTQN